MLARWIVFVLYLCAGGLLGGWLFVRLRGAWRAARKPDEGRTRIRIYVFALLCLFFSDAVARVITALASLVTGVFVTVPFRLAADDDLTARLAASGGLADSAPAVLRFVADHVRAAVAAAGLDTLPLPSIVLFLALFALVAMPILHPREGQADPRTNVWFQWFANVWNTVGPRRRQNFYLTVVLVGAGYLRAAALMAIPELDDARAIPESVSVEKLRERLAGIQIGKDELDQSFPEDAHLQKNPLAELESVLQSEPGADSPSIHEPASQPPAPVTPPPASTPETAPERAPKSAPDSTLGTTPATAPGVQPRASAPRPGPLDAKNALNRSRAERSALAVKWRGLRAAAQVQQRYAFDLAVLTYENENLNRIGARQTAEHFRSLINWYLTLVLDIRKRLSECHGEVQQFDVGLEAWARSTASTLRRPVPDGNEGPDGPAGNGPGGHGPPSPPVAKLDKEFCTLPPLQHQDLPTRANADDYLNGVFHVVSGWLVLSESLPMTLIIGMLGFALLGASVSPIVRSHKARMQAHATDEPLVRDLASLLIRGMSAAVVVFLGVKGGLSLLGAEDTSMNPYALLLTCFAAAVYSERAWNRVRDWFGSEKGEGHDARRGAGGDPPPSASASDPGEPGGTALPPT